MKKLKKKKKKKKGIMSSTVKIDCRLISLVN